MQNHQSLHKSFWVFREVVSSYVFIFKILIKTDIKKKFSVIAIW